MTFQKTERTKCGNCVFWEGASSGTTHGVCYRYPPQEVDQPIKGSCWCGEFVDREPETAKPAEPAVYDVWTETAKPAGELRECYVVVSNVLDPFGVAWSSRELAERDGHTAFAYREVPSPGRVRAALDGWAKKGKYKGWENVLTTTRIDMIDLLRSLGIDTEGV